MQRTRIGIHNLVGDLVKETGKNVLMGIPAVREWRLKRPRAGSYFTGSDAELERYAFLGLNLLRKYVGDVRGKHICEIGPGDYLTSGMAMLAAGAASYAVIDRFPGEYESPTAKSWYQAIEENWQKFYPETEWAPDLRAKRFPEDYADRLELIRQPIEMANVERRFDIICSFQVGEHVSNINAFAEINERLLAPNGTALHRVDFGPHDCWFLYRDPLTFLQFSDWMWEMTSSNRGTPNRRRHHEFLAAFARTKLQTEVVLLEHFDENSIKFERLNNRFQSMPRNSLLTATAIYRLRHLATAQ